MRTIAVSAALLALSACTGAGAPAPDGQDTSSSSSSFSSAPAQPASGSPSTASGSQESSGVVDADTDIIDLNAINWEFNPTTITVKKGSKSALRVTSTEGNHGIVIPDFGINAQLPEGQTVSVAFPTDRAGTFAFRCSVPCGDGHKEMTGTIVVEE